MKWIVYIGYKKFLFDTFQEAGIFAQLCIEHLIECEDKISIEPITDKEALS